MELSNKKSTRFTCSQLFFSLFLDLEGALNLLSLSKITLKRMYREMSSELTSLRVTTDNLLSVNQGLIIRISLSRAAGRGFGCQQERKEQVIFLSLWGTLETGEKIKTCSK